MPAFRASLLIFAAKNNIMHPVPEAIREAVNYIKSQYDKPVETGIILGSGLGNLINEMTITKTIRYAEIPFFPTSTVEGHEGKLIFGQLGSKQVVVMAGRLHIYEGYSPAEVAFPVRVLKLLGVHTLLISNAAGGVNPAFGVGDLMIITDHISLATLNPLVGKNEPAFGTRFPDMTAPYNLKLIEKAKDIAARLNIPLREGVYFGVTGPSFETRAEYKMIRLLGGDAVGMSTIQEVIAAVHAGLRVFGISVITDLGLPEVMAGITHQEVLEKAKEAEPKITALFKELVKAIG